VKAKGASHTGYISARDRSLPWVFPAAAESVLGRRDGTPVSILSRLPRARVPGGRGTSGKS